MPARDPLIHAPIIRRRRIIRWSLAGVVALLALSSLASHRHGSDWRLDGRGFTVTGMTEGFLVEIASASDASPVRVRLLGLSSKRDDWSNRARDHLAANLVGRTVLLRFESLQSRDNTGQLQGYLYMDGRNVNLDLARQGHARVEHGRQHAYAAAMAQAESAARRKRLGVWARIDQTRN